MQLQIVESPLGPALASLQSIDASALGHADFRPSTVSSVPQPNPSNAPILTTWPLPRSQRERGSKAGHGARLPADMSVEEVVSHRGSAGPALGA